MPGSPDQPGPALPDLPDLSGLSDVESRDEVEQCYRAKQAADALYLNAVRNLDCRPEAVPGARPGSGAATFLRQKLRASGAAADVRAAHTLAEDLPGLGAALAAGDVSRGHVDVAVRAIRQIPRHLLDRVHQDGVTGLAKVDAWVTETALTLAPMQTDVAAQHLLVRLDPDGADTFDPAAVDRRELTTAVDATGMVVLRGQLDPANGALLRAALDYFSKPQPASEPAGQGELPIPDRRSKRQRQADALGLIASLALGTLNKNKDGNGKGMGEAARPRVVVHLPAAECEQLGPMSAPWLARFTCDAVTETFITGPDGQLYRGRETRTATDVQRRALYARDRTCVIPGCHAPGAWCEAHHLRWWSQGGDTSLDNLALVCGRHHTDLHTTGGWTLEMINGVPWARPPTWIDPHQNPIRNAYREHRNTTEQLAIDLTTDPSG